MTNAQIKAQTGVGLIFPLTLDASGKAELGFGFPLIESDLKIFITWLLGTRYFLGNYGTTIPEILQNPNDDITKDLIRFDLSERLPYWDQRLEIVSLDITRPQVNEIMIKIKVRLKGTPLEEIFKFPITTLI